MQDVLSEFIAYIVNTVEKPHEAFGGMSVCPFAHKARTSGKVQWVVMPFGLVDLQPDTEFMKVVNNFCEAGTHEVLFVIHPDKAAMTLQECDGIGAELLKLIDPKGFVCFAGHPADIFRVGTTGYVAVAPYAHMQVMSKAKHDWGVDILLNTGYYEKWTDQNLRDDLFPYPLPRKK